MVSTLRLIDVQRCFLHKCVAKKVFPCGCVSWLSMNIDYHNLSSCMIKDLNERKIEQSDVPNDPWSPVAPSLPECLTNCRVIHIL